MGPDSFLDNTARLKYATPEAATMQRFELANRMLRVDLRVHCRRLIVVTLSQSYRDMFTLLAIEFRLWSLKIYRDKQHWVAENLRNKHRKLAVKKRSPVFPHIGGRHKPMTAHGQVPLCLRMDLIYLYSVI